jgi:hypothetical protein
VSYRYRVLHIADPHFSNCHFDGSPSDVGKQHAEELIGALEQHDLLFRPLDAVVFSGDFTFACNSDGFLGAKFFIETLATARTRGGQLVVPKKNIVVIPGNHDIDLGNPVMIGQPGRRQISIPTGKSEAEARYRNFLATIRPYVGAASESLSTVLNIGRPGGKDRRLVIVGLNSCRVERYDARGWGYVGTDQIYEVARELARLSKADLKEGDLLLAVTHHNMLPIWDLGLELLNSSPENRTFSFTMDTASTLGFLTDLGVGALLHGHTHVESMKAVEGYGSDPVLPELPLWVLGAGTLGLKAGMSDRNPPPHHFQLIEIETDPMLDSSLTHQNLKAEFHPPGQRRIWKLTSSSPPYWIVASWDPNKIRAIMQSRAFESVLSGRQRDSQDSWSVLRTRILNPSGWPDALKEIHRRVKLLEPGAAYSEIAEAVERLFINPPSEKEICDWSLEEYLLRNVKGLLSRFMSRKS